MDELPELPFEHVLSYLSLQERIKVRAVSRTWYHRINSFRVKSLYYSQCPIGRLIRESRWVRGEFSQNFISSTRFATFFDTFGQTILSSLKHLRLCDLYMDEGDRVAFARILNAFGQLEQLDIIRARLNQQDVFNLPMLTSLQLKKVYEIKKLTLEAPRLREVKILGCYPEDMKLEIVHGESVERLLVDRLKFTNVNKLKNLRYLCLNPKKIENSFNPLPRIDPSLLSSVQQLKEIHTNDPGSVSELFEQKQLYDRSDLKIYSWGLLLNGSDDPAINALRNSDRYYLSGELLVCLAENPSRLADEIPFYKDLDYSIIEDVDSDLVVDLLKRCTELKKVTVNLPVQAIQHFLNLLKNFVNIVELTFYGDQPQDLFDRLPEHCAVERLFINRQPFDLRFLSRLKHLILLDIKWPIDRETFRRAFEEHPALSSFRFIYGYKVFSIEIGQSKQFQVKIGGQITILSDLNAAIEFIFGIERPKKRKANDLFFINS